MTSTVGFAASPFRGLAHFGDSELDELMFFGRERETEIVTANLIASRLTVVYGPSGVGKSSLVRAGVARRVRELGRRRSASRGPDLVCVVFGSWSGDDPLLELAGAIGDTVRPLVSPTALEPPPGSRLADVVEHWSALLDGDICLVLDQVEESFVYDVRLLEELPPVVTRRGLRANVLLSVREDELARLGALKDTLPGVFANVRRLERLDHEAARAAILGPLARWNDLDPLAAVDIEPELVDDVLAAAASPDGSRIEAPYLQLLMERVWQEEAARGSRCLRASTLVELGGADAIVRRHLDRALESLALDQQEAAARMFGHLVTPSGTKVAHHASDLAAFAGLGEADGRLLLEALGRERVLRPLDGVAGAARRYEIFHDVLAQAIVAWGGERAVIAERRDARSRQRRLLAVAIAALVLAAVMVAVTAFALAQRSDARSGARHARAAALVADSLAALPDDPRLSLLLSREAAAADPAPQSTAALRSALAADRARGVLHGQKHGVLAAGLTGGRVVTVDGDGTLRTFPARSAPPLSAAALGGRVRAAAVATSGTSLVVARRRLVELHPLLAGRRGFAFKTKSPVRAIAIDGQGDRVAVTTLDGAVSVHGGAPTAAVSFGFPATSVALDGAGRRVAIAGGPRVAVWTPRTQARLMFDAGGDVSAVALSRDGTALATAGADGALRIWNARTGALTAVAASPTQLTSVVFSPDGRAVIAGGADGTARVYDTAAGGPISVLARHASAVTTVAISGDGRVLVTGSRDGVARIWDPGVAPELRVLARPAGCCAALATGLGGAFVAAGRRVVAYARGRAIASWIAPARVTALAASGGVVVDGDAAGRVEARKSGRPFLVRTLHGAVGAVATDGSLVAAAAGRRVVVFTAGGRMLRAFDERRPVAGLALAPDGSLVATAGVDGVARVRATATGRLVHALAGHTKALTAVAFSPDGNELATSSYDHDVRLWDARSGALRKLLRAHFAVVSDVAFSSDGRWLVTAGPVTAGLWDASSGGFLTYLRGPRARVVGAGFVDGGRTVVAASLDGTVRDYRCDICGTTTDLLDLAARRLAATGDALTPAERRLYPSP